MCTHKKALGVCWKTLIFRCPPSVSLLYSLYSEYGLSLATQSVGLLFRMYSSVSHRQVLFHDTTRELLAASLPVNGRQVEGCFACEVALDAQLLLEHVGIVIVDRQGRPGHMRKTSGPSPSLERRRHVQAHEVFFPPSPVVVHGHVREARLVEGPAHVVLDLLLQRRSGRPQPRVWPLPPLTRRHLRPDLPPQLRVPLQERDGLYRSTGGGHDVIVRAARMTRTRLLVCPGRPLPP